MIGTPSEYKKSKLIGLHSPTSLEKGWYFANYKEKGKIVASLWVKLRDDTYIIRDVFVLETERNKGYGTLLLKEIMDFLIRKNKPISLYVDSLNDNAKHVYEKIGFKFEKHGTYGEKWNFEYDLN